MATPFIYILKCIANKITREIGFSYFSYLRVSYFGNSVNAKKKKVKEDITLSGIMCCSFFPVLPLTCIN